MKRRLLLALGPIVCGLTGCGLAERPFEERRQWPLLPRRPKVERARPGARVLLVRGLRAGPGLDGRGLLSLQGDGSIRSAYYEEWAAPPALAAEEAVRRWLAESGLFAAAIGSASRLEADLVVEGELLGLWSVPAMGVAHAALGITVVAQRGNTPRVLLQQSFQAEVKLAGGDARAAVEAQVAALASVLAAIEAALRAA